MSHALLIGWRFALLGYELSANPFAIQEFRYAFTQGWMLVRGVPKCQ